MGLLSSALVVLTKNCWVQSWAQLPPQLLTVPKLLIKGLVEKLLIQDLTILIALIFPLEGIPKKPGGILSSDMDIMFQQGILLKLLNELIPQEGRWPVLPDACRKGKGFWARWSKLPIYFWQKKNYKGHFCHVLLHLTRCKSQRFWG